MKKAGTKKILKQQLSNLQHAYTVMGVACSMEAVHAFRVNFKQLRANARLIGMKKTGKPAIPRKLKLIYQQAGIVRNWQLFLQTFSSNRTLKRYALRSLDLALDEIQRMMVKNIIKKTRKKLLQRVQSHLKRKHISSFRNGTLQYIDRLAQHQPTADDDLHSIRKSLKDLQYDNLLGKEVPKKKYYTQLSGKIGALQNCSTELQLLSEINQQQSSTRIQKLLNNKLRKKNRLIKEIKNDLRQRPADQANK